MKTKFFFATLFTFLFSIVETSAQVGIGTTTPQGALDITSTNDGLVIPRVSLGGANFSAPLTAPVNSELVYNTNNNSTLPPVVLASQGLVTPGFYFWNSTVSRWERFVTGTQTPGWQITGNAGLSATSNFIGTTDAVDVPFRRNNTAAGRIGATSTSFGVNALTAGATTNGTAFGLNALAANTAANNTAFGTNALSANTTSANNTAIGFNALAINTPNADTGAQNTAVGSGALANLNGGNNNTAIGFNALTLLPTRSLFNTAVGSNAMAGLNSDATRNNVAMGDNTMTGSGTITNSVAIGSNALRNATNNSTRNTAIGAFAGNATTTGNDNVFIGHSAGSSETGTSSNKLYISNSNTTATTSLIYGEFAPTRILRTNSVFQIGDPVGTGYQFPAARGTNTQILQTNGSGVLSWVNPSALVITEVDPQVSSNTTNAIPKWNGTTLVDGIITDNGSNIVVTGGTTTTTFQMTNGANAGYLLQSDASGSASWVPNPLTNLSTMRINLNANQALTTGGWQKIQFNSPVFDTKSEFSGGSFTAISAGIYQVNAGFHTSNQGNSQFYSIGVYVNGSLYQQTTGNHFGNGPVSRNINCLVSLAAGGTVEIYVENYQPAVDIDSFIGKTFFEVTQIR